MKRLVFFHSGYPIWKQVLIAWAIYTGSALLGGVVAVALAEPLGGLDQGLVYGALTGLLFALAAHTALWLWTPFYGRREAETDENWVRQLTPEQKAALKQRLYESALKGGVPAEMSPESARALIDLIVEGDNLSIPVGEWYWVMSRRHTRRYLLIAAFLSVLLLVSYALTDGVLEGLRTLIGILALAVVINTLIFLADYWWVNYKRARVKRSLDRQRHRVSHSEP